MKDVAFAQTEIAFEIEWRDDLPMQNDVFDVRSVFGDRVDHGVAERFFLVVPVQASAQLVRRVLHEARHDVFAGRRDRRIGQRRNHHVDVRAAREVAVLGVVVGALHVFDAGGNRHCAAQVRAFAGHAFEVRQSVEREIYFAGRSAELVAIDLFEKFVGRCPFVDHLYECEARIDAG